MLPTNPVNRKPESSRREKNPDSKPEITLFQIIQKEKSGFSFFIRSIQVTLLWNKKTLKGKEKRRNQCWIKSLYFAGVVPK